MSLSFPSVSVGAIMGVLLLSGCASPGDFSFFTGDDTTRVSITRRPDRKHLPDPANMRRAVEDFGRRPKRDWVGQPQSAEGYADGTRLFAYRALRKKLTCSELKRALDDTTAATALLQPVRYEKVRSLATAVSRELKGENGKRCGPPANITAPPAPDVPGRRTTASESSRVRTTPQHP